MTIAEHDLKKKCLCSVVFVRCGPRQGLLFAEVYRLFSWREHLDISILRRGTICTASKGFLPEDTRGSWHRKKWQMVL